MKKILRIIVFELIVLYIVSQVASGMVFKNGIQSFLIAGAALAGATFVIKPIINLILLPVNMITFNLFRWVSHAIVLFLVDLVLDEFEVAGFGFAGVVIGSFKIDPITIQKGILPYIVFAFIIAIVIGFLQWIRK